MQLWKFFGRSCVALLVLMGGVWASQVQAVSYCGFKCEITNAPAAQLPCVHEDREPASMRCSTLCRDNCRALGMTYDASAGASRCDTSAPGGTCRPDGVCTGRCSPCKCTPDSASFSCVRTLTGAGTDPGEGNDCPRYCDEFCTTARYRDRISSNRIAGVGCASSPAARCIEVTLSASSRLAQCRECINSCMSQGATYGSVPVPADCYQGCGEHERDGRCNGVPVEQAIRGMTTTPTGAVSGSGAHRGRVRQSASTVSAGEAAALPPGECARRAVRADTSLAARITTLETTFGAASTTWTCRRVCSEQDQGTCVTGGCPGDTDIRCCSSATGISPAQQCGGRGAAEAGGATGSPGSTGDTGSTGSQGGVTEGGAARPSGSSSGDASSGSASDSGSSDSAGSSGESSRVGASSVSADSGGLTRLILPSCIHDGGCQFSDLVQVGLNLVRFLFGLAGVLLLVVFVYAGFEYLIAGDAAHVKSAEDRIRKALIGLFFMFFGYTLVNFLVGLFINA